MAQNNEPQQQQEDGLVKKQAKKLVRDRAIKVGKKVGKLAVRAVVQGVMAIGKFLLGLLAGIGIPYILGILGALALIVLIFVATSLIFGGDGGDLDESEQMIYNEFQRISDNTVDMSRPEQVPYKVPHALLVSVMQIQDAGDVETILAARQFGDALRPLFQYESRTGVVETTTTRCVTEEEEDEEGIVTSSTSCSTSNSEDQFEVELLVGVEAWDTSMTAEIRHEKTPWQTRSTTNGNVSVTSTSRADFFWTEEVSRMDYSLYDRELSMNPFNYGHESKLFVEALYQILGGEIFYKEWLTDNSLIGFDGNVIPGSGIPTEYMQHYLEAEKKYAVDWYYLAALHFIETSFSTHPTMVSSVGAEGHFQFMPCTWLGWSYPGCKGGLGFVDVEDGIKHNTAKIKQYGGYGVDGDGDGKADPWNFKDAVFTAANYLNKSGFAKNIEGAIWHYNHSETYVANVVKKANEFKQMAQYIPTDGSIPNLAPGTFMRPALGRISSPYGPRRLTGRYHYGIDIANSNNTPVVAVADGVVVKAHSGCPPVGHLGNKCGGEWGNHVRVQHKVQGRVYEAVYAHFTKTGVAVGQNVSQGQLLGYMGMSGSSTGVHLHFELHNGPRKGSKTSLNPAHYVPF